jgi:hypothetical protein
MAPETFFNVANLDKMKIKFPLVVRPNDLGIPLIKEHVEYYSKRETVIPSGTDCKFVEKRDTHRRNTKIYINNQYLWVDEDILEN